MPEILIKGFMAAVLIFTAVQDCIYKKISMWILVVGAVLLCACLPFCRTLSLPDRIFGLLLGGVVIGISKATRGKIGMGDGLLLCVTGIGLGFWGNLELFMLALISAAIVSIFLLIFRLADRKKSIPFVPFLLLGYIIKLLNEVKVLL